MGEQELTEAQRKQQEEAAAALAEQVREARRKLLEGD